MFSPARAVWGTPRARAPEFYDPGRDETSPCRAGTPAPRPALGSSFLRCKRAPPESGKPPAAPPMPAAHHHPGIEPGNRREGDWSRGKDPHLRFGREERSVELASLVQRHLVADTSVAIDR